MSDKNQKAADLIKQLTAEFISLESNRTSLITVTNIELTRDWGKATIMVTIYPEDSVEVALDFLNRKRDDVRDFIKQRANLRRIPFFQFVEDAGEKHRQHMDELFDKEEKNNKD